MQGSASIRESQLDELLASIFLESGVDVYPAYSDLGEHILQFQDANEVHKFAKVNLFVPKGLLHLAIRYPNSGPAVQIQKISLNPDKCNGFTFRFSADGWGLIHVLCEAKTGTEINCRISVNSPKRASHWQDTSPELGDPAEWDWPIVEKHARRLIRIIKKLSKQSKV